MSLHPDLAQEQWVEVCPSGMLLADRGVAASVDGDQVALFRLGDDRLFAIDDIDPFSGSSVLSRGLVGDVDGIPTVASPIYKQRFDLRTGECLEDPSVRVSTWPIRLEQGHIWVGRP